MASLSFELLKEHFACTMLPPGQVRLVMHPATWDVLKTDSRLQKLAFPPERLGPDVPRASIRGVADGIQVEKTEHVPEFYSYTRWVYPVEQFWEYEPHDEEMCRQLGLGHEETVMTDQRLVLLYNGRRYGRVIV